MEVVNGNSPPPFLSKTYDMVDDLSTDSVVSWSKNNNSFVVWNVSEFSTHILPKYFKHNNFSSFVRQLNTYGYRKVDPDCWEFANEGFLKGHKHLLKTISRRKNTQTQVHQETASQVQSVSVGSCIEVGIEEDVERLKRDKSAHMEELAKLWQQQQATDHRLDNVGERLQLMEQRQQQTMSFLAKALQSPGFIAELFHQQNESNRRIPGMNKKRRFPDQEEENYAGKSVSTLHDRQIVRYQPLMNEAAIAMLQKILKNNASVTNGFLTNHSRPFQNASHTGGTSSCMSGLTLPQFPTCSQSHLMSDSEIPYNSKISVIPEIKYSLSMVAGEAKVPQHPELNTLNSQIGHVSSEMSGRGMNAPETFGITDLKQSEAGDMSYIDTVQGIVDGVTSVDGLSADTDIDVFLDKMPKLPGINDMFWDQILSASPLTGDTHDVGSLALEDCLEKEEDVPGVQDSDCNKMKHMIHLT